MKFIQRLMYGRYGGDQLSMFIVVLYLILYLLSAIFGLAPLGWISYGLVIYGFFRMFSKNIAKRRAENAKFMEIISPVRRKWKLLAAKRKDRDHSYFHCPNCGQTLRVPKGKGRLNIHCRSCGADFDAKT